MKYERKTYIDNKGYARYIKTDRLVHRDVAYKYIYNSMKYPLRFSDYQIHHKDGNKLNNHPSNLELVTRKEHEENHGFSFENKKEGLFSKIINSILNNL